MSSNEDQAPKAVLDAPTTRILFVTLLSGTLVDQLAMRFGPDICVVDFDQVTRELLDRFEPDYAVSAILTPRFDILDLAQRLHSLKFSGAYRVFTDKPLPNPGVVLREVRNQCPGLDVDLISIDVLRR